VLSGRGLCDELITCPEESYVLWCVVVCDLETSRMGAPYIYNISRLRVNISKLLHVLDLKGSSSGVHSCLKQSLKLFVISSIQKCRLKCDPYISQINDK